jgi:hypothetical protein
VNWRECRATLTLLAELNEMVPDRDKASDGAIGDAAHASRTSQHNPDPRLGNPAVVRARDYDSSRGKGLVVDDKVGRPLTACLVACGKTGHPALGPESYVIFQRRIYSPRTGWKPVPYTGLSPHLEHVHLTASLTGFDSNRAFGLQRFFAADYRRPAVLLPRGGSGLEPGQVYGPDAGGRESWVDGRESEADLRAVKAIAYAVGDPRAGRLLRFDTELGARVAARRAVLVASGTRSLALPGGAYGGQVEDAMWRALARAVQKGAR